MINLLVKPFYIFVVEVGVQNEVGPAEYGMFFSLFNFCYLFQIISDLGINNYNNTSIAKDNNFIDQHLSKLLGLKIVLALLFFCAICLVAFWVDYPDDYYPLLWLIAINQILVSFILYFRTNISGLGFYKWDSLISILDKLLLISILGYLLWIHSDDAHQFQISWFVYAQMGSLLLTLLFVIFSLVSITGSKAFTLAPTFDISTLKKSLPFAFVILIMSAYSRIDSVMLERMLPDGKQEAGIYAASYRILDALNIIGFLFAGLLLPMFSKLIADRKDTLPVLILSLQLLMAIAIPVALYSSYFSEQLMMVLYPDHATDDYSMILKLLTWGFIGIATTHIFGTLLTANHSLKKMNFLFTIGLILNVLLNWYFIPEYKALAAAATTFVTEIFVSVGLVFIVLREFKYKAELRPILSLLIYGLVLFGFYYSAASFLGLDWFVSLILGIIVSFVVSLLLNIIDIRVLKAILTDR